MKKHIHIAESSDYSLEEVLIYTVKDYVIDKKTLIDVPDGYTAIVKLGDRRIGKIGPCKGLNIKDKLKLEKGELNGQQTFSIIFTLSEERQLTDNWGTWGDYLDKEYGVVIHWRANGEIYISISDPYKLLNTLEVKPNPILKKHIISNEKSIILQEVKTQMVDAINKYILDQGIKPIQINSRLNEIRENVKEKLMSSVAFFETKGLRVVNLTIPNFEIDESDLLKYQKSLQGKEI